MSLKKIRQVKNSKWFRIWDLIVYGAVIVVIVALFLAFHFTKDTSKADGVRILYKNETVFEYYYSADDYKIVKEENVSIESESAQKLTLTFYTDGKKGYNEVVIDKVEKSVKVTDADCSLRKDCVYTPEIKNSSGFISCSPHMMTIQPFNPKTDDDGNIIIG